jgi:hypothetical protein
MNSLVFITDSTGIPQEFCKKSARKVQKKSQASLLINKATVSYLTEGELLFLFIKTVYLTEGELTLI